MYGTHELYKLMLQCLNHHTTLTNLFLSPDFLSIDDLGQVFNKLYDARVKWFEIGLQLIDKLTVSDIETIQKEQDGDYDKCFVHLLKTWLRKQVDPKPTWAMLANALRSQSVGFGRLAETIMERNNLCTSTGGESGSSVDCESEEVEYICGCGKCSTLEAIEQCPNPIPVKIHRALVSKYRHLNRYERIILNERLKRESQQIQKKYLKVKIAFRTSLSKRITSGKLSMNEELVPYLNIKYAYEPVRKIKQSSSSRVNSVNGVMNEIDKYSSFFHFKLLDEMIAKFGTPKDKDGLLRYQEEFNKYAQRRIDECPSNVGCEDKEGHVYMIMKLDSVYNTYTVAAIHKFCVELRKQLSIATLYLCRVKEGCIKLTFQMPMYVYEAIFPLTADQETALLELKVLHVSCGEYRYPGQDKLVCASYIHCYYIATRNEFASLAHSFYTCLKH